MHPTPRPVADLESLAKLSAQPRDMRKGVACPLCRETLSSVREYERHVGRHQEQLALFALPSQDVVDDEGDDEEERSDESIASNPETGSETAVRDANKSELATLGQLPVEVVAGLEDPEALASAIELLPDVNARIVIIRKMLAEAKPIEFPTGLTAAITSEARKRLVHMKAAKIIKSLARTQRELANALQGRLQWELVASRLHRMQRNLDWLQEALEGKPITELDLELRGVLSDLLFSLSLTTEAVDSRVKAAQALVESSNSTGGASTERTMEQREIPPPSPPPTKHYEAKWICVSSSSTSHWRHNVDSDLE